MDFCGDGSLLKVGISRLLDFDSSRINGANNKVRVGKAEVPIKSSRSGTSVSSLSALPQKMTANIVAWGQLQETSFCVLLYELLVVKSAVV